VRTIGIFGTSGFAREVADIVDALGDRPIFVARDQAALDAWAFDGEVILEGDVGRDPAIVYAIGIGDNAVREQVARRFADRVRFPTLIHPSATFGRGQRQAIEASDGVIVCAGVRFSNNIRVGRFAIFNPNATIGHDVVVEDFVQVSPGACISGNVRLGTRSWIGTGAAVNQGTNEVKLSVGADTVVGSGAVVVEDCDEGAVYVGVPARRIKSAP
jgi:sugar O-acyltransferase (sialic acid O-acetyltransferase NeuD family)